MPREPETRDLTVRLDEHTVVLAAEALRGEADRRRRVGIQVSAELADEKRAGQDIRTGAIQVVNTLAEAAALAAAADSLADAWEAGKPPRRRRRSTPTATDASPSSTGATEPSTGDDDDAPDDELDDEVVAEDLGDGSTAVEHLDDPDVAAAREALGLDEPVAGAAAAPPAPEPSAAPAMPTA